jgi:hypothetical protein
MDSIDQPHSFTTLGFFLIGLFILSWSSSSASHLGYELDELLGSVDFFAIGFGITLITIMIITAIVWIGLTQPIRTARLLRSPFGLQTFLITIQAWHYSFLIRLAVFIASMITFSPSFLLDRHLERSLTKADP